VHHVEVSKMWVAPCSTDVYKSIGDFDSVSRQLVHTTKAGTVPLVNYYRLVIIKAWNE